MSAKKRSYHTLRDFFFIIFKHKILILLLFLISVISGVISSFVITPVYEAYAKLLVKEPGNETISLTPQEDAFVFLKKTKKESTIDTAAEILSGRYLAEKVLIKFGIRKIYPEIGRKVLSGKLNELEKALIKFQKSLTVTKGNIIEVRFLHEDPVIAASVVNTLIEEFLDYYLAVQKQDQKYDFFKKQVTLIEKRLQNSQNELGLFRNQNNISSIQKQKSLLLLQISDLEVELAKIRAETSEQEATAENLEKTTSALANIQKKVIALKSKEQKLYQHIIQYKLELNRLDRAETRLQELERQVKMDEENYLLYTKKMEKARIANAMDEQKIIHFSVIEPALQPITPVKPRKVRIITISIILGCLLGLLMAFISEYFTHTFDHREDIEEILSCAAIASFPEMTGSEGNQLKILKVPEKIMEKCNRLKHYFVRTLPGKNKAILFCSSKENEGTSTILINFALTLAMEGERVMVIDANLRNPSIHKMLNVDEANGLSDIITQKNPLESVIKKTQLNTLEIITSGSPFSNPFALFQSEQFNSFLQGITTKADWILFDSPPINTYNDACIMASKLDGVTMVVKAGKTRWEVASSAENRFKQCKAVVFGAVLNRQKPYIPEWLYKML